MFRCVITYHMYMSSYIRYISSSLLYRYVFRYNHRLVFKLTVGVFTSQPVKVVQYNINTEELYSYLKEFIHMLYFR